MRSILQNKSDISYTLSESMSDMIRGYGIMDKTCGNVNIINELDIPVLVMGIHNEVVLTVRCMRLGKAW